MEWVQTLKWPAQIETDKPPPGISWVELAIDFLFLAQPTILTSVKEDGSTRYKNNEEHVGFDVKAHGFTKTVNSFRDSLEQLAVFASNTNRTHIASCKSLVNLFTRFRTFLTPGPNGTAQSFWNHPEVPKRPAEIAPRIAAPTDNTSAARNRRYNKRRQEIKRARAEAWDIWWSGTLWHQLCFGSWWMARSFGSWIGCWFGPLLISHHLLSSQDVLPGTELGRALLLQHMRTRMLDQCLPKSLSGRHLVQAHGALLGKSEMLCRMTSRRKGVTWNCWVWICSLSLVTYNL